MDEETFRRQHTSETWIPAIACNGSAVEIPPLHLEVNALNREMKAEAISPDKALKSNITDGLISHLFQRKLPLTIDRNFQNAAANIFNNRPLCLVDKKLQKANVAIADAQKESSGKSNEIQIAEWLNSLGEFVAAQLGGRQAVRVWFAEFATKPVSGGSSTQKPDVVLHDANEDLKQLWISIRVDRKSVV